MGLGLWKYTTPIEEYGATAHLDRVGKVRSRILDVAGYSVLLGWNLRSVKMREAVRM